MYVREFFPCLFSSLRVGRVRLITAHVYVVIWLHVRGFVCRILYFVWICRNFVHVHIRASELNFLA